MWGKLVAALLAIALLIVVLAVLGRAILSALRAVGSDGGATTADPMFREEAVTVTRPPEPDEGVGLSREDADPSASWTVEEEGPVDQTAEELADEAAEAGAAEEAAEAEAPESAVPEN